MDHPFFTLEERGGGRKVLTKILRDARRRPVSDSSPKDGEESSSEEDITTREDIEPHAAK